jgi:hypothetical protein
MPSANLSLALAGGLAQRPAPGHFLTHDQEFKMTKQQRGDQGSSSPANRQPDPHSDTPSAGTQPIPAMPGPIGGDMSSGANHTTPGNKGGASAG